MKSLQELIKESLINESNIDESLIQECTDWIVDNYRSNYHGDIKPEKIKFAKKLNAEGKLVASCPSIKTLCLSKDATSITNGKFVWDDVKKEFSVKYNENITSLEGCPKVVGELFEAKGCPGLKNLIGGPIEAGFYECGMCENLESLEGSPEKIEYVFNCSFCNKLKDLSGFGHTALNPISLRCSNCKNLTSLNGCPKELKTLSCVYCDKLKSFSKGPKVITTRLEIKGSGLTEKEVTKWCTVNGEIYNG